MPRTVVVIGNFDGVHRGHSAVLTSAVTRAKSAGLSSVVLTFDPHPSQVLGRGEPPRLTTMERRIELLHRVGIDRVVVRHFDLAFAAWSPERFATELLAGELGAREVVVGRDFRFGSKRAGDFASLIALGKAHDFTATAFDVVSDASGPLSSSRVRAAILAGDLDGATAVLGHWHALSGVVVEGQKLGRTIGFPTANLGQIPEVLPPDGIYAVVCDELLPTGARALAKGAMSIGLRPTIAGATGRTCETYFFDLNRDLYGAKLRIHLVARLRDELKLAGLDELKARIAQDCDEARQRLASVTVQEGGAFG
ncbi:MAG: Riboflavin kinase [Myxococcaceae bacterium]|nr:Riboflavin kinase [Myxococcaceae bacterium]